jgi:predicted nucleotidyltransferase
MQEVEFEQWLTGQLAALPGVLAVALGGSRAQMTHRPDSDWDFAIYYRGQFEPRSLREKGWEGEVSEVGGWGGGVMNGGAWLTVDGRRVDVHYRDLDQVEHWCAEAEAGRFQKELLMFYVAGIPTYVVMGELAINRVLAGTLPRPGYPEPLATSAGERWRKDATASLGYAGAALRSRRDVTVALSNAGRGLVEAAHSTLAYRRQWALNEKGIVARAGLGQYAQQLLHAVDEESLETAIMAISGQFTTGPAPQFEAVE